MSKRKNIGINQEASEKIQWNAKNHFELQLKECEFRFNYRLIANMYKVLYNWIKEAGLV